MVTGIVSQKRGFYFNSFVLEGVVSVKVLQRKIQRDREQRREREKEKGKRQGERDLLGDLFN